MDDPEDSIVETREELMVSPTGQNQTRRTAHFLRPSIISSIDAPYFEPHNNNSSEPKNSPLEVTFNGWLFPQDNWKIWVERLRYKHESTWKRAAISEAIVGSTYKIHKYPDLVLELAQKWRPETNTFVFHWGETTITLEDMMLCGDYSVLGCPVFSPPETFLDPLEASEMKKTEEELNEARLCITRSKSRKACQHVWMRRFIEEESEFEHEAFLSLWLSRFVFPGPSRTTILKHLFPLAVRLARGTRIALAPAVLATIYRDLTLLKGKMAALIEQESEVTLWAPFQLVHVWAWERFLRLRPEPNLIERGEPRLAQWHKVKKPEYEKLQSDLDCGGEWFLWRPYAKAMRNCVQLKFYREKAEWVLVDSDLDEELESFARCLRASELVGIDCSGHCIEQYLPHRVAMQFGMDQDLPGSVVRHNQTHIIAWKSYNKPISCSKLYIPSRFFYSGVTSRYYQWWKRSKLGGQDEVKSVVRGKRWREENDMSCPPGFAPKCKIVECRDSEQEDKLTLTQMFKIQDTSGSVNEKNSGDGSPSMGVGKVEHMIEPVDEVMQNSGDKTTMEDKVEVVSEKERVNGNEGERRRGCGFDLDRVNALEVRIAKLEESIAKTKAARAGNRLSGNQPIKEEPNDLY